MKNKIRLKEFLFFVVVLILSVGFVFDGQDFYFGEKATIREIVFLEIPLPYAYRALVPALARAVMIVFGATPEVSLYAIMLIFAIGAGYALRSLFRVFWQDDKSDIHAMICLLLLHLLIYWLKKPYDYSTIFLFPLAILLIHKRNPLYLYLFPLIVLSRETAFLLAFFYLLQNKGDWKKPAFGLAMGYQVAAFFAVRFLLKDVLSGNGGEDFYISQSTLVYLSFPPTVLIGAAFVWSLTVLYKVRDRIPPIIQDGVIVFVLQVVLHLFFGMAFEVRVLAEFFPLMYAGYVSLYPIPPLLNSRAVL